ncbi:MAG: hypothetical protein KGK01_03855 [Bradyrhizobium sp.]|nr:hypothetical protein [Bradyrhizobium sp.]MDE2241595.1 hypothetical protein [Bradyrhizobium sp.]
MRKYDLIAISLLVFSAIIVAAISVDPNQFSIKDWQPLMAAFAALGAAGVAYQGVTLTYKAAIRKVDLDRSIHEQEVRRRQRGIYLRTALAAHIMHHEADHCCQSLLVPLKQETAPAVFDPKMTGVTTDPAIDEAWQNLDAFSRLTADDLSRLKVQLYNYETATKRLEGRPFEIPHGHKFTEAQQELCNAVAEIRRLCLRIRDTLRKEEIVVPHT